MNEASGEVSGRDIKSGLQSVIEGGNLIKGDNADRPILREWNFYFARYATTTK
jgi:hypothetical protein